MGTRINDQVQSRCIGSQKTPHLISIDVKGERPLDSLPMVEVSVLLKLRLIPLRAW